MKNRVIKVIKPGTEPAAKAAPTTKEIRIKQEKEDAEDVREMTGAVKNWISERRENSLAEQKTAKLDRNAWNKKTKLIKKR